MLQRYKYDSTIQHNCNRYVSLNISYNNKYEGFTFLHASWFWHLWELNFCYRTGLQRPTKSHFIWKRLLVLCVDLDVFQTFFFGQWWEKNAAKRFCQTSELCREENETFLVSAVKANEIKKRNRSLIQYLHQGTPICTDTRDLWKLHLERPE